MRTTFLGLGLGVVVVLMLFLGGADVSARPQISRDRVANNHRDASRQSSGARGAAEDLIAFSYDGGQGGRQITLIDPNLRVMAVYEIEHQTGKIALRSTRNIQWDLRMEEFNGLSPSPREIRSLLERRPH